MIKSLVIGIGLMVFLIVAWALVQTMWKNVFKDEYQKRRRISREKKLRKLRLRYSLPE